MNRCFWCGTQCSARFCGVACQTAAVEMPDLVARPEELPEPRRLSSPARPWLLGGLVFLLGAAMAFLVYWPFGAARTHRVSPCYELAVRSNPSAARTVITPPSPPQMVIRIHRQVRIEPRPVLFSAPAILRYEMKRGLELPPLPVIREPFSGSLRVMRVGDGVIESVHIQRMTAEALR